LTRKIKSPLKEIHFVTGKGGVGKSTFALILAHEFSRKGHKTLLTEIGDRSFYSYFLGLPVHYNPQLLAENLEIAHWSASECLRSYALSLLKVEALYRLFFQNPVSRSLIQVAPSLSELAVMGQITSAPRQHGPYADHEILVVDSYATGHFLNLLRAPSAMGETIQFGPMGEQSREMDEILRDTSLCHLHIVTTAEELPITETDELQAQLKAEFGWVPNVVLNRYLETTLKPKHFPSSEDQIALLILRDRLVQQEWALHEIRKYAKDVRTIPLVESVKNEEELLSLIEGLS